MPPKPKYTKEEIIDAAYLLVCERGADALTAREVGNRLGTSSSPIFTVFRDMEELKDAVRARAKACFDRYMETAEQFRPAYKKRGMQWVKFAQEQPMLFRLLFMEGMKSLPDFDHALQIIPFGKENDIAIIQRDYHASAAQAEHLFRQMWVYTYGLCTLCAAQVCSFTEQEIAQQLGEIFRGMIFVLRQSAPDITALVPAQRDTPAGAEIEAQNPDLRVQTGGNPT